MPAVPGSTTFRSSSRDRLFTKTSSICVKTIAPSKICVVMKANAYGHGLTALAPVAVAAGADYLGVCTNPEAAAIRQMGIDVPLLRLRMGLPEEFDESAASLEMDEQVGTWEQAEYLSDTGQTTARKMPVHVNIDTGMGRSGFFVEQADLIRKVCGLPGLKIRGVFTHFAKSDAADLEPTKQSLDAFDRAVRAVGRCVARRRC